MVQDDACKAAHGSEADCAADAKCTWCTAGAVPSSCFTKENARRLPPGVFHCGSGSGSGSVRARAGARRGELLSRKEQEALGIIWRGNASDSHERLDEGVALPKDFSWCDKDGQNYCTMSRNQHIPQYCGSCWAHGAVSALADRVKIARGGRGPDINPSVQHLLNCGNVGSCSGGSVDGPYQWLLNLSRATGSGLSYETAQPYLACTPDSSEGFCPHVDTTCRPDGLNVARTCGGFASEGGPCTGLASYPNVTVSDHGSVSGQEGMMREILHRGPISCGIDANPLLNYESGILKTPGDETDHVVSVTGWGTDPEEGFYWIVRNSWGEYWGSQRVN